ncbi:MAG TPA: hypothetical protein VES95_09360 [Dermatophilaceae bacterium]|nr:hypothetical protein [Dermatophilaceae bacterium]
MTQSGGAPNRVRVTSARRGARPLRSRPVSRDLDEQTGLGDVYLAGLMRAQLRLTLQVLAVAAAAVGGFPLLLLAVPATRTLAVAGIPFPWLVLGVAVYPAVYLLARWYTRQAERLEAEFSDVVGPS